jgi:hypothetical protein
MVKDLKNYFIVFSHQFSGISQAISLKLLKTDN